MSANQERGRAQRRGGDTAGRGEADGITGIAAIDLELYRPRRRAGSRAPSAQGEREGHRLICERIMRTVSSDGGTGVGIGTGRIRQRPVKKV